MLPWQSFCCSCHFSLSKKFHKKNQKNYVQVEKTNCLGHPKDSTVFGHPEASSDWNWDMFLSWMNFLLTLDRWCSRLRCYHLRFLGVHADVGTKMQNATCMFSTHNQDGHNLCESDMDILTLATSHWQWRGLSKWHSTPGTILSTWLIGQQQKAETTLHEEAHHSYSYECPCVCTGNKHSCFSE